MKILKVTDKLGVGVESFVFKRKSFFCFFRRIYFYVEVSFWSEGVFWFWF
jgi:hypothetical protein